MKGSFTVTSATFSADGVVSKLSPELGKELKNNPDAPDVWQKVQEELTALKASM